MYSYERDYVFMHTVIIVYVFVFSYDEKLKSYYILNCLISKFCEGGGKGLLGENLLYEVQVIQYLIVYVCVPGKGAGGWVQRSGEYSLAETSYLIKSCLLAYGQRGI